MPRQIDVHKMLDNLDFAIEQKKHCRNQYRNKKREFEDELDLATSRRDRRTIAELEEKIETVSYTSGCRIHFLTGHRSKAKSGWPRTRSRKTRSAYVFSHPLIASRPYEKCTICCLNICGFRCIGDDNSVKDAMTTMFTSWTKKLRLIWTSPFLALSMFGDLNALIARQSV